MTTNDDVKLLAGGNPQIPKGDGDGPVQAYLDAIPDWKGDIGRHLDDELFKDWIRQAAQAPGDPLF